MDTAKPADPSRLARTEFWQGVADIAPILLGVAPFGVTYGIVGLTVGLTPAETLLMSLTVFAGAAQFVAATMVGLGVRDFGLIVFTTLLINLRHLLMGASLAPYLTRVPMARQALLAFGMVDETYAVAMDRIARRGYSANHQFGTQTAAYIIWALSTLVGVVLGKYIPDPLAWGLDFALPATFLAMLIPRLVDKTSLLVCLTAGVLSVAAALYLPGKWYIIVACLAATLVGGLLDKEETA